MKKPRYTTGWHSGRLVDLWSGHDCREVCEHGSATGGGREGHGRACDTLYVAVRTADDEGLGEATSMTISTGMLRGLPMPPLRWRGDLVVVHAAYPTDAEQVRGEPEECAIVPGGKCFTWGTWSLACASIFTTTDAELAAPRLPRDDEGLCRGFHEGMPAFWSRLFRWHEEQAVAARAARAELPHRCAVCNGTGLVPRGGK